MKIPPKKLKRRMYEAVRIKFPKLVLPPVCWNCNGKGETIVDDGALAVCRVCAGTGEANIKVDLESYLKRQ